MNASLSVGCLLVIFITVECYASYGRMVQFEPEADFDVWANEHGKNYGPITEYYKRRDIFRENVKLINKHNYEGAHTYTLGVNQFADLTHEEFSQLYLLTVPQNCSATHREHVELRQGNGTMLPKAVDWRKKGMVSPVKNQGKCGSCWAFSTIAAMEAHMAIETNSKYILAEQQLVDCAQAFGNHGCSGGLPSQAFEYIHYNPGVMAEENYPYTAKDGKCKFQADKALAYVKQIFNITEHDEAGIQVAVATHGPVSIAYQVASDFRFYKSGVYKSKVCRSDPAHVNHAVLIVGYDVTPAGEPYWIVKNSWGEKFGMAGYFWIYRGSNMCGLSDCASFPITSKSPTNIHL